MNSGIRIASMAAASALLLSFSPVSAEAAGGAAACAPRSEVRGQVADLVAGLRDDVSAQGRSALAEALVQALRTWRGDEAETAAERQSLGRQLSELIAQRRASDTKIEAKALVVSLKSVRERREPGAFTGEDQAAVRAALEALRQAVVEKTDSRAEGRAVATAMRAIVAGLPC